MNRRDFMKGILAAACAPAIVKAENIMRINPRIIVPRDIATLAIMNSHGDILGCAPLELRRYSGGIELVQEPGKINLDGLDINIDKCGVAEYLGIRIPGFERQLIPVKLNQNRVIEDMTVQMVGDLVIS